jgi:outer membrane receptor protein involved in Fe transport
MFDAAGIRIARARAARGERFVKRDIFATSSLLALVAGSLVCPHGAFAEDANQTAQNGPIEEVVVTGTRIERSGYEAPTPLTVVSIEQIQQQATANVADFVNTLPALSGSQTPSNTLASANGSEGINSLNLRNLGAGRTLVLLDGQRSVGAMLTGVVDVNSFPQQLISRVDIVTGGASAAYGSDALSGVVNFVLDKTFTGVKGELSGGVTTYGDDRNYKVALSAGTGFANDRGHLLLSGEIDNKDGILFPNRAWNDTGWGILNNPNYTATNGQPKELVRPQVSSSKATLGGLIISGPLKGISFGPGGIPVVFNYGALNDGTNMMGGDWRSADIHNRGESLDTQESRQNAFLRISYDITDDINVYGQFSWTHTHSFAYDLSQEFYGGVDITTDNPFIPASVAAQAAALKLASFTMGTDNGDLPPGEELSDRIITRNVVGGNGKFDAFDTNWTWDAYFQNGISRQSEAIPDNINVNNYFEAIDAVRDPKTGAIVCRTVAQGIQDGCVPFNPFGTGVNSQAAKNFVLGINKRNEFLKQNVFSLSLNGDPFSNWAGPVSLATGIEHRSESVRGIADPLAYTGVWYVGNYIPTFGSYTVTEGFVETVFPLAKDVPWAKTLDLNAAARFTGYSTSGFVTTWKAGLTYSPIDDVRFRVTRSRDIRAANLQELFAAGSTTNNALLDPFNNNITTNYVGTTSGNPKLEPEKADTTGLGVVLQPSFIPGLSVSVDYWNIDVKQAIGTVGAQDIINFCFEGNQTFCSAITRGVPGSYNALQIAIVPFNLAESIARGIDIDGTYRLPLASVVDSWDGTLTFRMVATNYLKAYTNDGVDEPTDSVGQNSGMGPPRWRWTGSATYDLDPINISFSARGVSSGTINNQFVECASGCPVSTVLHPTIDNNYLPGAIYFDMALAYKFGNGAQAFFNVRNLADKDPAITPRGPANYPFDQFLANPYLYDVLGRVFRAGVRFKY